MSALGALVATEEDLEPTLFFYPGPYNMSQCVCFSLLPYSHFLKLEERRCSHMT